MEKSKIFIPYVVLFLMIATFSACGSKAKKEGSGEMIQQTQQTTTTTERPMVKETTTTTTTKTP